jgi:hypothetical protein
VSAIGALFIGHRPLETNPAYIGNARQLSGVDFLHITAIKEKMLDPLGRAHTFSCPYFTSGKQEIMLENKQKNTFP